MKRFGWLLAVVMLTTFAMPVAAAEPGGVKSQFYKFDTWSIDGDIKKPTTLFTDARHRVRFDRLLKLKKSFMEPMLQTAKEQAFK